MVRGRRKSNLKKDWFDTSFKILSITVIVLLCFSIIYPFWSIFIKSFMSDKDIIGNPLALWTNDFQLDGYRAIFTNRTYNFGRAFLNSVYITLATVIYQLTITTLTAYVLSRKNLPFRKTLTFYFVFTMYFGGGLIPYYLLIKDLKLYNTLEVMIFPHFMSVFNMLVMRSFFLNFPKEIEEAAIIDGASKFRIFVSIVLPLSKAVLATIAVFIGVSQWNNWYSAMLFIADADKRPLAYALQIIIEKSRGTNSSIGGEVQVIGKSIQYAGIVVSILPIMVIYPFLQKHFIKGVTIGAVKE